MLDDTPPPDPATGTPKASSPSIQDDHGVPPNQVRAATTVGLMLIVIGGAGMILFSSRVYNAGALCMCVGFGLVLAAFGARAAGAWRSWSATGGAAIAALLFFLLHLFPDPAPPFVRGHLHKTNRFSSVQMFAAQFLLVGRAETGDHFRFVAFPDDLRSPAFYVFLVNDKDPKLQEAYIGCIPTTLISSRMGSTDWVNFTIETTPSNTLSLRDTLDDRQYGTFGAAQCPDAKPDASGSLSISSLKNAIQKWPSLLSTSAFAQSQQPIPELLRSLEADSSEARAASRNELAKLQTPADFSVMTSSWNTTDSSYRADLGRLVAWSSAIRKDRENAVPIASALSPEQVNYLFQLTGHPDKTMRLNATQLLSWLMQSTGWSSGPKPEKSQAILQEANKVFADPKTFQTTKFGTAFDDANVAFNTLVAVNDARCALKPEKRQSLALAMTNFEEIHKSDYPKSASLAQKIRPEFDGPCKF